MTIPDIRLALRTYLLADGSINSVVNGRVFPTVLMQGETRPSIVYTRVSGAGDNHMMGPSGLSKPRFQISCWSQSADTANALSNLVKERIDGWRGPITWGDGSPDETVFIQGIFFDIERDLFDEVAMMYATSRDYFIWYEEQ